MKLRALVNPRADGTVIADGLDKVAYVFKDAGDGDLVAEITHTDTVMHLLRTGNFEPADAEGFEEAIRLMPEHNGAQSVDGVVAFGADPGKAADDLDNDSENEVVSPGGLLIDANTPPKPKAPKPGKK